MPVGRTGDRCWDQRTSSVNGLPDVAAVDTACNLFDKDGGEALRTKVLMHAEEVDLGAHNFATIEHHLHGDACNHAEQTALFASANTNKPSRVTVGREERPSKEVLRVVESEHGVGVFHVITNEKLVNFLKNLFVLQVQIVPLVLTRELIRFLGNIFDILCLNLLVEMVISKGNRVSALGHRLAVPELVRLEKTNDVAQFAGSAPPLVFLHLLADDLGKALELV